MTFTLSFSKKTAPKADTAVVGVYAKKTLDDAGKKLDKAAKGFISQVLKKQDNFEGKSGQTLSLALPKGAGPRQVVLLGLGEAKKLDGVAFETLGGKLWPHLKTYSAKKVSLHMPTAAKDDAAARMALGLRLRAYAFDKYKSKKGDKDKGGVAIEIVTSSPDDARKTSKSYEAAAQGVDLARDVMNDPANVLYPESYAAIIAKQLKALGVNVEIIDHKKMQGLGFGAHLAVGMGSGRKPCVVVLRWNGKTQSGKNPLAFVGKGVTFDTGGYSIKPAGGMEDMKYDMGGSAAVAGLFKSLALRKAKVDAVGI